MGLKIEGEEVKSSGCIYVKDVVEDREEVGYSWGVASDGIYISIFIYIYYKGDKRMVKGTQHWVDGPKLLLSGQKLRAVL